MKTCSIAVLANAYSQVMLETKTERHSVALILKVRTPLSLQMVSAPQNGMALFVGLKDLQEGLFLLPVQSICMTSIIKVRLAQDKVISRNLK